MGYQRMPSQHEPGGEVIQFSTIDSHLLNTECI